MVNERWGEKRFFFSTSDSSNQQNFHFYAENIQLLTVMNAEKVKNIHLRSSTSQVSEPWVKF